MQTIHDFGQCKDKGKILCNKCLNSMDKWKRIFNRQFKKKILFKFGSKKRITILIVFSILDTVQTIHNLGQGKELDQLT